MNAANIFNSLFALVFVLCLIGLVSILLRKYGTGINLAAAKGTRRMQVKEVLNIDAKKKIVIVAVDGKEHVLAFNESKIELIDNNINEKIS